RSRTSSPLSLGQLERLIRTRRKDITRLEKKRSRLEAKLAAIDEKITALGGPRGGGTARARNDVSLIEALTRVLTKAGEPMNVGNIMDEVVAMGYRSNSSNFRGIVNQTLISKPQFVSTARGMYTLKKK